MYMLKRRDPLRNLRHLIFERDSYTCIMCSDRATDLHHVVPRSQGGSNTPYNLVSLCRLHHRVVHGDRIIWEIRPSHVIDDHDEAELCCIMYLCDLYAEEMPYRRIPG